MSLVSVGWRRHSTWQAFEERVVTRAPSLRQYTNEDNDEEEDEEDEEVEDEPPPPPPPGCVPFSTGSEHPVEVMMT